MPLHEVHRKHWLLFGVDLIAQKYFVYDSSSSTADADRADLVRYAVSCTPPSTFTCLCTYLVSHLSRENAHVAASSYGPRFDASLQMCSTSSVGHSIPRMSPTGQVSVHTFAYRGVNPESHVPSTFVVHVLFAAFVACSGHDCGLYVMTFMDVLSMKTDRLYFDPSYARNMRDLCLLSILQGKVAHFPDALRGTSI